MGLSSARRTPAELGNLFLEMKRVQEEFRHGPLPFRRTRQGTDGSLRIPACFRRFCIAAKIMGLVGRMSIQPQTERMPYSWLRRIRISLNVFGRERRKEFFVLRMLARRGVMF